MAEELKSCNNWAQKYMGTRVHTLTAAAVFTLEATAQCLSKVRGITSSALHQLLWQAQKLGTTPETLLTDFNINRYCLLKYCILYEKTENSIFDSPSLSDYTLLLMCDTQTCFKNTKPHHLGGKEKKGQEVSCSTDNIIPHSLQSPIRMWSLIQFTDTETTTGATDIQNPFKCKAGSAGLNENRESEHRLKKVWHTG